MRCVAIVTGLTGQDGSYLAEFLLEKGYTVFGLVRRVSTTNLQRVGDVTSNPNLRLLEGDLCDGPSLRSVVEEASAYDRIEVYNLAAQSHVHTSFRQPEYTADVDALGPLRLLDIIRSMNLQSKTRFYQASTSELYGKVVETPQSETTPFHPRSPYAVAKLYAYWIVRNYREAYGIYACNGILFNHESERRGAEFVTRKITLGVARSQRDPTAVLEMGNLDTKRDWGYAPEYVRGMWAMLQQDTPRDYVLATGTLHTIRECIEHAFRCVGTTIRWTGTGVTERGYDADGRLLVRVNPEFYRPCEVDILCGDATLATTELGWTPTVTFEDMIARMVAHDLKGALEGKA
jgi:GDPmannose 4,6-dehydratase